MRDLERQLEALATEIEWPETPLPAPLPALARGRRRRRRPLLVALAAVLLAAAVAAAVPGARSAILEWFRIGGVGVERVETLPSATPAGLADGLGDPVDRAEAARLLGTRFRAPRASAGTALYARERVVSALLATATGPVLLSELRADDLPYVLKQLAGETTVEFLEVVPGSTGAWIAGARHVVLVRSAPARLSGHALLWEHAGVTFRLEGPRLTRAAAVALARAITRG